MRMSLKELKLNQKGVVISISGEGRLRRRLFDMGITPGATIVMRKVAPLGDPIEVNIRGYELTMRKSEAETVLLEVEG